MNEPSNELAPHSEEEAEFTQFLEQSLAPGPLRLSEARKQAVLTAFADAAHAQISSRRRSRIVVLLTVGAAAAACLAVLLTWNHGKPSGPVEITRRNPEVPTANVTPQQSLDHANLRLAILNSQLAAMERQLAWIDAREFRKQQERK